MNTGLIQIYFSFGTSGWHEKRLSGDYFAGGSSRSWNFEARRSEASTRLFSLPFSFMANLTLSVALHSPRLLRESKTVILTSVGEMSFRVELCFSSRPVCSDTWDELESWTPESPVEAISIIKSAFSGVSTKVNRPQPSIVDLITSGGIRLPCVRVIKTFLAAASLIEGVSMSGLFSAG